MQKECHHTALIVSRRTCIRLSRIVLPPKPIGKRKLVSMDISPASFLFGIVDMHQFPRDTVLGKQDAAFFKKLADGSFSVIEGVLMSFGIRGGCALAILVCRYIAAGEYMC